MCSFLFACKGNENKFCLEPFFFFFESSSGWIMIFVFRVSLFKFYDRSIPLIGLSNFFVRPLAPAYPPERVYRFIRPPNP